MTIEEKPRRGRPRPETTKTRDDKILTYLQESGRKSRNEIAEHFGLPTSIVYLSLSRLRADGKVRTCGGASKDTVWTTEVEEPCP